MKELPRLKNALLLIVAFWVLTIISCRTERIAYFKDIPDTLARPKLVPLPNFASPVVRPDDILNVTIQTLDPQANLVLNQGNLPILSGTVSSINPMNTLQQQEIAGYLVNKNGYIHMSYIGDVYVAGYTTNQVRDTVTSKISLYFKDPVVNVRFANFKVTVLGEVRVPATYTVPNEKPTVIDAIGLAGDITIYGRHDNVMLIRDNEGTKEIIRLNLDSSSVINSPYFYLKPNDVLYVEPTPSRVESTNAFRIRDIAVITAGLSLLTIIVARLAN